MQDSPNRIALFRNYKVQPCSRPVQHDWKECPFHHPGDRARRRDPFQHYYFGVQCLAFRTTGLCPHGDDCEFAHGPFEIGLHPCIFRTKRCHDISNCWWIKDVCFYSHTDEDDRRWNWAVADYLRHHRRMPPMTVYDYGWVQEVHRLFNHPRPNVNVSRAFHTYLYPYHPY